MILNMYFYTQPNHHSTMITFSDKDLGNFSQLFSKELQTTRDQSQEKI